MKQIPIKRRVSGHNINPETLVMETIAYALVDDKHYDELSRHTWTDYHGYPKRYEPNNTKSGKKIPMHVDIWCRLEGHPYTLLDHEDRNPLNNQTYNLRPATKRQNGANKGLFVNSTTGFKGVGLHKKHNKYRYKAQIKVNGKLIDLGHFNTALEAAEAYDRAATEHFGEFATTNQSLGLIVVDDSPIELTEEPLIFDEADY